MTTSIVTVTLNPSIDKNTSVDYVVPDDKLRCQRPTRDPGGGGLNVSRVVHRLGGSSTAMYTAGGPTGKILKTLLDQEKIVHEGHPVQEWTRENLIVVETSTDKQYRFGMPGPRLQQKEWQQFLEKIKALSPSPDYLVASGSLPPGVPDDFYARLAGVAQQAGSRFIVDTSGEALRQAADKGVYLLKPNLRELQQLTNNPLDDEGAQHAAANQLIDQGQCEVVILSLGAAGALLATRQGIEHLRSPTVPIKSKVGAGDSMVGGIVSALARGFSIREAALYGISAGAAAVMTEGTELCQRDDTEHLYQQLSKTEAV